VKHILDDGGRKLAGFKGDAGDCVVRSVAIASGRPYAEVYAACADIMAGLRKTKGRRAAGKRSASDGVYTTSKAFKTYIAGLGFVWTPTMKIGEGCRVHLADGELPMGRLIVKVSRHVTAVIDGVVHDTYDPQREAHCVEPDRGQPLKPGQWRNSNGVCSIQRRCVYGYWALRLEAQHPI
jgi:hypothetical protein